MVLFLLGQLGVVVGDVHFLFRLRLRVTLAIHFRQEFTHNLLPRLVERAGLGGAPLSCEALLSDDVLEARSAHLGLHRLRKDCLLLEVVHSLRLLRWLGVRTSVRTSNAH